MAMRGNLDAILTHGVVNELFVLGRHAMQTTLNDMVAIEILD